MKAVFTKEYEYNSYNPKIAEAMAVIAVSNQEEDILTKKFETDKIKVVDIISDYLKNYLLDLQASGIRKLDKRIRESEGMQCGPDYCMFHLTCRDCNNDKIEYEVISCGTTFLRAVIDVNGSVSVAYGLSPDILAEEWRYYKKALDSLVESFICNAKRKAIDRAKIARSKVESVNHFLNGEV